MSAAIKVSVAMRRRRRLQKCTLTSVPFRDDSEALGEIGNKRPEARGRGEGMCLDFQPESDLISGSCSNAVPAPQVRWKKREGGVCA